MVLFFYSLSSWAQLYNKDIAGTWKIDRYSEFISFTAMVENKTLSDRSLRYSISFFIQQPDGSVAKDSKEERFVLAAGERKQLNELSVSENEDNKVTLLLLIYDLEDRPIGKDRVVLNDPSDADAIENKEINVRARGNGKYTDQAAPQDGFTLDGLVIENTITQAGRDFYQLFYSDYYNKGIVSPKDILIEEVPGRGRRTRITVKVDRTLVWQFFAQPRRDYLKEQAEITIRRVLLQIQRIARQNESLIRY
ncbi:CsgE family curli-type amyloid fiber assembly protein [Croceiramulus getboli]|nr:CsgE family curli-type amyloid fiber assembly protein [Flavobacteriaceae bacterium YJPT1-3]